MLESVFGNTSWQNHWLAVALCLGVIGMLVFFGMKSKRTDGPSVTKPQPTPTAPVGTKAPTATPGPTKHPKKKKKKKNNRQRGSGRGGKEKDPFSNWGPPGPAAPAPVTALPGASAWV